MKPMVILTGPTAVGKTELSIRLAKILNAEIISADSMQVYKKMDIGTAKIRPEEMEGVKHYLVDELDPREEFHVARFQQMAKDALEEIYAKGKIPLIVGGTGFYIQSLLYDIDFTETPKISLEISPLGLGIPPRSKRTGEVTSFRWLILINSSISNKSILIVTHPSFLYSIVSNYDNVLKENRV